jgi:hypothetical protein
MWRLDRFGVYAAKMVNVRVWISSNFRSGLKPRKLLGLVVLRQTEHGEIFVDAGKRLAQQCGTLRIILYGACQHTHVYGQSHVYDLPLPRVASESYSQNAPSLTIWTPQRAGFLRRNESTMLAMNTKVPAAQT